MQNMNSLAKEYALAEEYITYRTQRDFERLKSDRYKLLVSINFSIKTGQLCHEMLIVMKHVLNTQRDLTAGIVVNQSGLQMLPKHVANAHQKGDIH